MPECNHVRFFTEACVCCIGFDFTVEGFIAGSTSDFASVRSVQPYKSRNLIKVNELLSKNQVYVNAEYFDFVYDYIRSHCPKLNK